MIWMVFILGLNGSPTDLPKALAGVQEVYDQILNGGRVDYAKLHSSPHLQEKLQQFVTMMGSVKTDAWSRDEKLAYFSNAYNVFVLVGIIRAWPIGSVMEIRPDFGFFSEPNWLVANRQISLNDLEKNLLRPLDVRIHFIVNCGSISCPPLPPKVLAPQTVQTSLEQATQGFLGDPKMNRFNADSGVWQLSKIFEWYASDFGAEADLIQFIQARNKNAPKPKRIEYLEYDWGLNRI